MQRIIALVFIGLLGWYGYGRYQDGLTTASVVGRTEQAPKSMPIAPSKTEGATASAFKCDGRTYCSQMTSCAEATFFLQNCPGTKMDGNGDGIPCEKQWCK